MPPQNSKRSRKRRSSGGPPRAVASQRRELRAERRASVPRDERRPSPAGAYGERPPSPFGGLPISEIAIFAGAVGLIVGLVQGGGAALIVGVVVCALGVIEVTAREHFSGYRSHATLLAAIPAVGVETGIVALLGRGGLVLLLAVVPVFGGVFLFVRKRFDVARQRRLARPPS